MSFSLMIYLAACCLVILVVVIIAALVFSALVGIVELYLDECLYRRE